MKPCYILGAELIDLKEDLKRAERVKNDATDRYNNVKEAYDEIAQAIVKLGADPAKVLEEIESGQDE